MLPISVSSMAAKHGISIALDQEEDWTKLLQALDANVSKISAMDDYLPFLELQRYPRTDIHIPKDTVDGGWALRVSTAHHMCPKEKSIDESSDSSLREQQVQCPPSSMVALWH